MPLARPPALCRARPLQILLPFVFLGSSAVAAAHAAGACFSTCSLQPPSQCTLASATDAPPASGPRHASVLPDPELDGDPLSIPGEEEADALSDPIQQAVVQMSKVLSLMHAQERSLDDLLDRADGGGSGMTWEEEPAVKAALYLRLCRLPKKIRRSCRTLC